VKKKNIFHCVKVVGLKLFFIHFLPISGSEAAVKRQ
jgi:hypothetical protein